MRSRVSPWVAQWLSSPCPRGPVLERVARKCGECSTWLFGATAAEAGERLAGHRRRCHEPAEQPGAQEHGQGGAGGR